MMISPALKGVMPRERSWPVLRRRGSGFSSFPVAIRNCFTTYHDCRSNTNLRNSLEVKQKQFINLMNEIEKFSEAKIDDRNSSL